ncbi:MAG: TetR family transcriptional regulator [Acidimicrobiales bacterium]
MARIAGVTAEETRERLLDSAADVFARLGYDGASIGEIAAAAGVTSGAIYGHFGSKADLFAATLRSHGADEVDRLLALGEPVADPSGLFHERGLALQQQRSEDGSLLVEAIVAAKRHPEIAEMLSSSFAAREQNLSALLRAGQRSGVVDDSVRTDAVARFLVMVSLGALLVAALDLPSVDDDDWSTLVADLVGRFHRHTD